MGISGPWITQQQICREHSGNLPAASLRPRRRTERKRRPTWAAALWKKVFICSMAAAPGTSGESRLPAVRAAIASVPPWWGETGEAPAVFLKSAHKAAQSTTSRMDAAPLV